MDSTRLQGIECKFKNEEHLIKEKSNRSHEELMESH